MKHQPHHELPADPRKHHRHSQVIRRVYDLAALPRGVIASYDPETNILLVAADYFDCGVPGVRQKMLACTSVMFEYQAYQD